VVALIKKKVDSFFFEYTVITDDTFLAMKGNNSLCHVSVEKFSGHMVHHSTSPVVFLPLWTRVS
jgi:hypothetical protein